MDAKPTGPAEILKWQAEMGADEAISTTPMDWFALAQIRRQMPAAANQERPAAAKARPAAPQQPRPDFVPVAQDEAVLDARKRAASAASLGKLEELLRGFDGCALKATARSTCFKRGSDDARIMLIGEAPGRDEDIQGQPFVGRAGQLLDRMLASIGLDESRVYITNIVYWRPPGNRTPTTQEVEACKPFLMRQIELLDPTIIVLIGGPASQHLLDTTEGITRMRGKWREAQLGGKTRPAMPTLHPAYLLRSPAAKRMAWQDLLTIERRIKELGL
ncbi:MAG: uracil-DNA glycosylase [Pseudomonadota bacterium]|nr:uracil-DNA glycosylase [Pseudomonadota bacterium]